VRRVNPSRRVEDGFVFTVMMDEINVFACCPISQLGFGILTAFEAVLGSCLSGKACVFA